MRRLVMLVLLVGCGRGASSPPPPKVADAAPAPPSPPASPPAPIDAAAPPADACRALTRAECLASDTCTLHLAGTNQYQCRADANACEIGIRQQDKQACAAKSGCTFAPPDCYCECPGSADAEVPDDPARGYGCGCACGGGPPAMCTPSSAM